MVSLKNTIRPDHSGQQPTTAKIARSSREPSPAIRVHTAPFGGNQAAKPQATRRGSFGFSKVTLHNITDHSCYRCEKAVPRRFRKCPQCSCPAFYSGVKPTRVICPPDDPIPGSASWDAQLRLMGIA